MIAAAEDTQFGKVLTGHAPIEKESFYAVKVVPAILGTMTGMATNLDAEVWRVLFSIRFKELWLLERQKE